VQISSQIITTNKPTANFLQARCPSCHPTNSARAQEHPQILKLDILGDFREQWSNSLDGVREFNALMPRVGQQFTVDVIVRDSDNVGDHRPSEPRCRGDLGLVQT